MKKVMKKAKDAKGAEGGTVKTSPKMSPKLSPKMSPKMSPKASPKAEKKAEKKKADKDAPPISDAEREKLAKEALEEILKGLSTPEIMEKQAKAPWVPSEWQNKYRPYLGKYKEFCSKHPDKLTVVERDTDYVVVKKGEKNIPKHEKLAPWMVMLRKAWDVYAGKTPASERDVNAFIKAGLPKGVNTSPKMSPKSAPADVGMKKKKRPKKK
jgi:hypothetical protein